MRGVLVPASIFWLLACGSLDPEALGPKELRINEAVSDNEGVWLDERGETDDYVELYNASDRTLALSDYALADRSGEYVLPRFDLTVAIRALAL